MAVSLNRRCQWKWRKMSAAALVANDYANQWCPCSYLMAPTLRRLCELGHRDLPANITCEQPSFRVMCHRLIQKYLAKVMKRWKNGLHRNMPMLRWSWSQFSKEYHYVPPQRPGLHVPIWAMLPTQCTSLIRKLGCCTTMSLGYFRRIALPRLKMLWNMPKMVGELLTWTTVTWLALSQ